MPPYPYGIIIPAPTAQTGTVSTAIVRHPKEPTHSCRDSLL